MKIEDSIKIAGPDVAGVRDILTSEAVQFLAELEGRFGEKRRTLLERRQEVQKRLDDGGTLDFLPKSKATKDEAWRVRPVPHDLVNRTVEITGPVDRKMVINALNSGANVFMADFEDSNTPTWENQIQGQLNLRDAVQRTISFEDPNTNKHYALTPTPAVLIVRPRGLHMEEHHVMLNDTPLSASFFDFALYLFHNHARLVANETGPYFYLPKLESHLEARLWEEVITFAEEYLNLERGTVRVTVLIETIPAVFEMEEILYELREHITGLNCGRWDYIFNFLKRFSSRADFLLPDRNEIGMTQHFLHSYSLLLIQTCHRRGAHAMGGMAAQIPIKNDPEANERAMAKFVADKTREASDGHDGTWVAHPALVDEARKIFQEHMPGENQLENLRKDVSISRYDLLELPKGSITQDALHNNIRVALIYITAWLLGKGCVPINNVMEDAATAEISRAQLWQWLKHNAVMTDGRVIDQDLIKKAVEQETEYLKLNVIVENSEKPRLDDAVSLLKKLIFSDTLEEFLTTPAYKHILDYEKKNGH